MAILVAEMRHVDRRHGIGGERRKRVPTACGCMRRAAFSTGSGHLSPRTSTSPAHPSRRAPGGSPCPTRMLLSDERKTTGGRAGRPPRGRHGIHRAHRQRLRLPDRRLRTPFARSPRSPRTPTALTRRWCARSPTTYGDKVALISERETDDLPAIRPARRPVCALGHGAWRRQGRRGGADDAEPAGISGGVARHCTRAGGVIALLNTNLTGSALAHCINIVKPKHIIVDAALVEGFRTAEPHLAAGPQFWCHGAQAGGLRAPRHAARRASRRPDPRRATCRKLTIEDSASSSIRAARPACPRRPTSIITACRASCTASTARCAMKPSDRIYVCLPDVPHVGRRARARRGADGGRERRCCASGSPSRCSGTTSSRTTARSSSISASSAAIS